ncbi:MAG: hypothetical protein NC936_02385 [Candidatus Omnitrophica bacterium]|nr:hypothetical protein [Candidatus Omnitrophota bacterium]
MRRLFIFSLIFVSISALSFAQPQKEKPKTKILLMISEQNIQGPSTRWWLSEVDLSTIESNLARLLIEHGYQIIEPSVVNKIIKRERPLRVVDLKDKDVVRLGKLSNVDYVVLGKAVASAGSNVLGSNMRSCFANVTVKLIRVKDGVVIAYLDSIGSTVHTDVITGGKEALANASVDLAAKIISNLNKEEVNK